MRVKERVRDVMLWLLMMLERREGNWTLLLLLMLQRKRRTRNFGTPWNRAKRML
jgi:hypothetical protein